MKHKHADLIHAWADGAEIQYLCCDEWVDLSEGEAPAWELEVEYRIKPEEKKPVVRWLWCDKDGTSTCHLFTEQELRKAGMNDDGFAIKLEWSRTEFPE